MWYSELEPTLTDDTALDSEACMSWQLHLHSGRSTLGTGTEPAWWAEYACFYLPLAVQWAGWAALSGGVQDLPQKVKIVTSAKILSVKINQTSWQASLSSNQCLALPFGSRVAPWPVGLKEPGFLWTGGHFWLDSQVSTKGKPLSQLSTLNLPLSHAFSMLKKGWKHTSAFLSGGSPFLGEELPLCQIWSELAKDLSSDGVELGCGERVWMHMQLQNMKTLT